jgi:hypothetical protein
MESLSKADEAKLLASVKEAVDLVDNDGHTPDEALIKVARARQLTPGFVRSTVNAYNTGRQLAQWRSNDRVLDKLASFPLADYDKIVSAIWGSGNVKAAGVSDEYSRPPAWLEAQREKAAHVPLNFGTKAPEPYARDPQRPAFLAHAQHQRTKAAAEETRRLYSAAHDRLDRGMAALESYFQKLSYDRLPFWVVDQAVQTYYGAKGSALMSHLASRFPKEKRASATDCCRQPLDRRSEPFTLVEHVMQAARDVVRTKEAYDAAFTQQEKAAETLRPFSEAVSSPVEPKHDPLSVSLLSKEGNLLGTAATYEGTKALLDRFIGPQRRQTAINDAVSDLDDPDHEDELRAIRHQTMLSSMMSDPDNPLSGFDPEAVMQEFNQVAQMAPRVAEQRAALQPLLARRLSGHTEPFEVKEVTDLEKGLKDSRTPSLNLLNNAPNSFVG